MVFSGCSVQKDIQEDINKIQEDVNKISKNLENLRYLKNLDQLNILSEVLENLRYLRNLDQLNILNEIEKLQVEELIEKVRQIVDSLLSLVSDNDPATDLEDFGIEDPFVGNDDGDEKEKDNE